MTRTRILNGQFDPLTLDQTVTKIFEWLNAGQRGWLSTVNVSILMAMRKDPRLQSFVDRSTLSVADGQPLVWCARLFGSALPERVTGVDLVAAISKEAADQGKRVFLLGATDEVVKKVATRLRNRYPALKLDFANGYFSDREAASRADHIRLAGTDILFVAMGVPRQERFIESQWDRLGVGVAIGVGGSFDVLSGIRTRAPHWIQVVGMEWLFRLIQEPRRLFVRYLTTNTQFLLLVLRHLISQRMSRDIAD